MKKFLKRKKPARQMHGYSFNRPEAQIVLPQDSVLKREDVLKAIEESRARLNRM